MCHVWEGRKRRRHLKNITKKEKDDGALACILLELRGIKKGYKSSANNQYFHNTNFLIYDLSKRTREKKAIF